MIKKQHFFLYESDHKMTLCINVTHFSDVRVV